MLYANPRKYFFCMEHIFETLIIMWRKWFKHISGIFELRTLRFYNAWNYFSYGIFTTARSKESLLGFLWLQSERLFSFLPPYFLFLHLSEFNVVQS